MDKLAGLDSRLKSCELQLGFAGQFASITNNSIEIINENMNSLIDRIDSLEFENSVLRARIEVLEGDSDNPILPL